MIEVDEEIRDNEKEREEKIELDNNINKNEEVKQNTANNQEIEAKQEKIKSQENDENSKETCTNKKSKKKVVAIISVLLLVILIGIGTFIFFFKQPIVSINGKEEEIVEVGCIYIDKGINAYTKFQNISDKVVVEGEVDTSKLGRYTITYKVPYLGSYKEYKRYVTVIDEVAPEIKLNGEEEYIQNYGAEYVEPGYEAIDNYDGDITEKVEIEKIDKDDENYDIKYIVMDSSNNKTKCIRHVKIVDKEAPTIKLNGNPVECVILGNQYQEKGATALDNKDGDISSKIKRTGNIDTSREGTYLLTYSIEDSSGNKAEEQRKVIVNTVEKAGIIYLTIDDGPSSSITPQILDILKEKGVHATFFVVNYGESTEYLIKRELDEGHSVGIHGYSHDYAEIYTSADACYENITKLQEKIYNSTGKTIKIVRFPGGSSNTVSKNYCEGVMTEITQRIISEGYKYYDWNVDSRDAGGAKTKDDVYNNVISSIEHGRSNVVLMHDFGGNTKTLEALSDIIDFGLENGYVFDVIKEDTPMVTHTVLN